MIIKLINVDYLNYFFPVLLESNFEARPHDGRLNVFRKCPSGIWCWDSKTRPLDYEYPA